MENDTFTISSQKSVIAIRFDMSILGSDVTITLKRRPIISHRYSVNGNNLASFITLIMTNYEAKGRVTFGKSLIERMN